MIEKLSEINGNVSWMDWSMISILILFGTLVITVMIMWWRVISNIAEVVHIRRVKAAANGNMPKVPWVFARTR